MHQGTSGYSYIITNIVDRRPMRQEDVTTNVAVVDRTAGDQCFTDAISELLVYHSLCRVQHLTCELNVNLNSVVHL